MNIFAERTKPFLKWAGGKTQLLKRYAPYFPKEFKHYHEPFLGGGSVFFYLAGEMLLFNCETVSISDIDKELIQVYQVVRDSPRNLLMRLKDYERHHSEEWYYFVRDEHKCKDLIDVAARFIYLNKTCFNGLHRKNEKGQFNTPCGSCKNPVIADEERIYACSQALQGIEIMHQDVMFLATAQMGSNHFIYMDPPYAPIKPGSFTSYGSGIFNEEDQQNVANVVRLLTKKGAKIMLSNSDTPLTRDLYKRYNIVTFEGVSRSISAGAAGRKKVNEILVINYEI